MAAAPQDNITLRVYYHTPIGEDVVSFNKNVSAEEIGYYAITLNSDILKNIPVDGYIFKYWMSGPISEESTIYSVGQVIEIPSNNTQLHLYGFYEPIVKQKNIKARHQQKIDTEANWNKAVNFIPLKGEIIIYEQDNVYPYERIKIGDGTTTVTNLPFVIDEALAQAKQSGTFDGKSAYEFAQEGGFTGTEEEFAKKLAFDPAVFYVTINESDDGFIADKTLEQVTKALEDGKYVYTKLSFMDNLLIPFMGIEDDYAVFMTSIGLIAVQLFLGPEGDVQFVQTSPEEQLDGVKISNPNSLTINVIKPESEETIEYDGEQQRDITIVSPEAIEYALTNVIEQAKVFADWDNISNKPFETIKGETVLPLTDVEYIAPPNNIDYTVDLPKFDIIKDKTYQITFNGKNYNCVGQQYPESDFIFLGNLHAGIPSLLDTGEPFIIIQNPNKQIVIKIERSLEATTTEITVGVKKLGEIKYLNNKYLDFLQGENSFNTIFPLTELALDEDDVTYNITESLSLLKETFYNITINGNSYTCQSTEFDADGISLLALGNLAFINDKLFENTGEPFILLYLPEPLDGELYGMLAAFGFGSNITLQIDEIETNYQLKDNALSTEIPVIKNASAGQVVSVKAVDENGKPTEWEAQDIASIEGLATEQYVQNYVNETILGGAW